MSNIKIITAADSNYYKFLISLEKNIHNIFNQYLIIYDLSLTSNQIKNLQSKVRRVEINKEYASFDVRGNIRATHKPLCILDCLREYKDSDCIYIDSDILFTQYVSYDVFADSDIAVAHRHPKEQSEGHFMNGLINTGFIYFRNTHKVHEIVNEWYDECCKENSTDQIALSNVLSKIIYIQQAPISHEVTEMGIKINILDPNIYNDTSLTTGNILHFKNAGRSRKVFKRYKTYYHLLSINPFLLYMYMMIKKIKLYFK